VVEGEGAGWFGLCRGEPALLEGVRGGLVGSAAGGTAILCGCCTSLPSCFTGEGLLLLLESSLLGLEPLDADICNEVPDWRVVVSLQQQRQKTAGEQGMRSPADPQEAGQGSGLKQGKQCLLDAVIPWLPACLGREWVKKAGQIHSLAVHYIYA
jgi:hypothetical protein